MKALGIYLQPAWASRSQVYTYRDLKTRIYKPTPASRDRIASLFMAYRAKGLTHIYGCARHGKLGNMTIHGGAK